MAITDFHLLLLEHDPRRRESMLRAARQAGLKRLRAFNDASEARSYFDRVSEGETPDGRVPSLLLLNLDEPSGMEILSWLRSRPKLRRVVAVDRSRLVARRRRDVRATAPRSRQQVQRPAPRPGQRARTGRHPSRADHDSSGAACPRSWNVPFCW